MIMMVEEQLQEFRAHEVPVTQKSFYGENSFTAKHCFLRLQINHSLLYFLLEGIDRRSLTHLPLKSMNLLPVRKHC